MIKFSRFKIGIIVVALLAFTTVWAPDVDAASKKDNNSTEYSDMNNDGIVDYNDLVLFSTEYLGQSVDTVDWCDFYYAVTNLTDDVYGRTPGYYQKHFTQLLGFINTEYCELSDLNDDRLINARDLMEFSEQYARQIGLPFSSPRPVRQS